MKEHILLLKKDDDIKDKIVDFINMKKLSAGIIGCVVGSTYQICINIAGTERTLKSRNDYKIVGANGTLSLDGLNINMMFGDRGGIVLGGTLQQGCLIDKDAEIVILELDNYRFERKTDEKTGYSRLVYSSKPF